MKVVFALVLLALCLVLSQGAGNCDRNCVECPAWSFKCTKCNPKGSDNVVIHGEQSTMGM